MMPKYTQHYEWMIVALILVPLGCCCITPAALGQSDVAKEATSADVADSSTAALRNDTPTTDAKMADPNMALRQITHKHDELPRGLTSFGACITQDKIYVIGGKSGPAHEYAKAYQNPDVYCLDISQDTSQWKSVGQNLGLQGLALVSYNGQLYRIGGLEARNAEGEEDDLHSVDSFAQYNPQQNTWKELSPLPESRSSFDACVAGDEVYVIGGWKLAGSAGEHWCEDMLVLNLKDPAAQWQRMDVPFRTRALATRFHQGKIYAIGGISENGGPNNDVYHFDLKSKQWSPAPAIPCTDSMKSFGCSAVSVGQHLLVSTYDGNVYRLNDSGNEWNPIHHLGQGRFFHQLLPIGQQRFAVVGGSHMEAGSQQDVEIYEVISTEK